jgi:hypothetical protein
MIARPLRRWMTLAAIAAVSAWVVAASAGSGTKPTAVITQASGTFSITNSRDGQAIFQAHGLAPGRSVTGTVQLSNAGTLAGDLGLHQLDVVDQPGANGGLLSNAVQLDVQDITGGNLVPVFAGQLASLQSSALGSLAPGEARTYRFTASLPDSGPPPSPTSGDNSYAGSAMTVRYSWQATAPDEGGGGGGGGGTGGGGGGPTGTEPPVFTFKVVSKKVLKKGILDVMATCDRPCTVQAYAQLPKPKRARKSIVTRRKAATIGVPNKAARIRIKLSKKNKAQLKKALRKKKKVTLTVRLSVAPATGGSQRAYSKKVVVKRSKKKARR